MDPLFLKRDYRKVKHDNTISVNSLLYEVPPQYIGQRVDIRFDENNVFIYEDGNSVGKASLVNFSDNAHVKREPAVSFKDMVMKKEV